MVARDFPEMSRSIPIRLSVRAVGNVSAQALSAVRALTPKLKEEVPGAVKTRLTSADGIDLGCQAPYLEKEIRLKLEPLGIEVIRHDPASS